MKQDSVDYDISIDNTDVNQESPTSLKKLMEMHDPIAFQKLYENYPSADSFMDLTNRLHLAALTSLKGEIIELTNRFQHVSGEKNLLEKQVNKAQTDKLRLQRECEDKLEQITSRYEERITELHSVIAELRKKIERHNINVIREEDEFEDQSDHGAKSNEEAVSVNENNANESQTASIAADLGQELNTELSHMVGDLQCVLDRKHMPSSQPGSEEEDDAEDDKIEAEKLSYQEKTDENDSVEEKAIQVCKEVENLHFEPSPDQSPRKMKPMFHPPPPPPPAATELTDAPQLQVEVNNLQLENGILQEQLARQQADINTVKVQLCSMRDDRDRFKKKMKDLQSKVDSTTPHDSRTSTPVKSPVVSPTAGKRSLSGSDQFPVAKIAELKKLKTSAGDKQQVPNAKVAEHLVQSLQECSNMQEIVQTVYKCGNEISENKIREFEIEFERLTSKIDHWKSQYDLLSLNLEESKAHTDRLSVLIGKYESNNTALQLAINYSDQAIEAYELLCALLESELGVSLANFRAAGLGGFAGETPTSEERENVTSLVQRAHHARRTAENVAKHLLQKLDRSCGIHIPQTGSPRPWEDLSSNSRTTSTTSSNGSSTETEFTKSDEYRLREYIQQLKNDRAAVKMTVLELESIHVDPLSEMPRRSVDSQSLDLENAVLMQELMAMKEEKAELKSHNYLLEKEKKALELRLSDKETQAQAYRLQIEHLTTEVQELQQQLNRHTDPRNTPPTDVENADMTKPGLDIHSTEASEAQRREKKLKSRIQELMLTLEKLSRNSEIRHQQSAEFVNDLKRANCALISAFEKAKKKYQSRLKKMELQMQEMSKQYENQIRLFEQRLAVIEKEKVRGVVPTASETSL